MKREIHFDVDRHGDRRAIFGRGLELPLARRFHRFFVESHSELADDTDIARAAVRTHDERKQHRSLMLGATGLFGEVRLRFVDRYRSCDAATYFEYAATVAA